MALQVKKVYDAVTLLASGVRTDTNTGTAAVRLPKAGLSGIAFILDVTAVLTDSGDLLDVYVQTKIDGTNWMDVIRFTQILGNGGTKRYYSKIKPHASLTEFETSAALGEHTDRDLIGDDWRTRYVITDAGTDNASFTFSVIACPM